MTAVDSPNRKDEKGAPKGLPELRQLLDCLEDGSVLATKRPALGDTDAHGR